VRILGAGVSGLATALFLARRGVPVEVRDRRPGGGRFSGGFQVLENASSEEDALAEAAGWGLDLASVVEPLHRAAFVDPWLEVHEARSERAYAYLIRRGPGEGTLDRHLLDAARAAGARVERGGAGNGWEPDVVATGPVRADGVARERVFRTDAGDLVAVLFDPDLVPTGYAYLFVRGGHGTLGAAQVRRTSRLPVNARRAFRRLLELFPVRVEAPEDRVLYMNFGVPRALTDGHRWYVGEAAGVQDFLYGLGNRLALRTAALAAAAIAGEGWDAAAFREGIVRPMIASVAARAAFETAGAAGLRRLCRYLAGGDLRERLVALQRPTAVRRAVARLAMAAWRGRPARRVPVERWARRRA